MSEVIVLDTHIWFWWITQEFQRFPSPWRDIIEMAEQVGVSAPALPQSIELTIALQSR